MTIALLLLILFTAGWYLLAMLPALRELQVPTDVRPLRVIGEYDGSAAYFARSYLAFLSANFPGTIIREYDQRIEGLLHNGTPYALVPYQEETVELTSRDLTAVNIDRVLLAYAPIRVPDQIAALTTVYAARDVSGGRAAVYRCVFGDADIWLGQDSIVLRWIHAEGSLTVDEDSKLYGRVSAGRAIRLMPGCSFQRLAAPRIELGAPVVIPDFIAVNLNPVDLQHLPERTVRRHVARYSLAIPQRSFVGFDLIASGSVRIGAGSWVAGSVKSGSDIYVESGSHVEGSLVAGGNVFIGAGCTIRGPVIAEANVLVDGPARIGSETQPSTVSAPCIYCAPGVVVFGTLWAREAGLVEHPAREQEEPEPALKIVAA